MSLLRDVPAGPQPERKINIVQGEHCVSDDPYTVLTTICRHLHVPVNACQGLLCLLFHVKMHKVTARPSLPS